MRRWIVIMAVLLSLLSASALAVDLDGLSLEQLLALRAEVDAAIWQNDAWSAAVLPPGAYIVDQDVPAGRWVVRAHSDRYAAVAYGYDLTGADHLETLVDYGKVCPADNAATSTSYGAEMSITLEEGGVLVIRDAAVELSRWLPQTEFKEND